MHDSNNLIHGAADSPVRDTLTPEELEQHLQDTPPIRLDHRHVHEHEHEHRNLRFPFSHNHQHAHAHNHLQQVEPKQEDTGPTKHEHSRGYGASHSAKHWPHHTYRKLDKARRDAEKHAS